MPLEEILPRDFHDCRLAFQAINRIAMATYSYTVCLGCGGTGKSGCASCQRCQGARMVAVLVTGDLYGIVADSNPADMLSVTRELLVPAAHGMTG